MVGHNTFVQGGSVYGTLLTLQQIIYEITFGTVYDTCDFTSYTIKRLLISSIFFIIQLNKIN